MRWAYVFLMLIKFFLMPHPPRTAPYLLATTQPFFSACHPWMEAPEAAEAEAEPEQEADQDADQPALEVPGAHSQGSINLVA